VGKVGTTCTPELVACARNALATSRSWSSDMVPTVTQNRGPLSP
jgi:hypothetical protein